MAGNSSSGRPPKIDEVKMIEKLSPLDDYAFEQLRRGIERGEFAFIKLFYLYRWGRPRQLQDVTINSEQPIFDLSKMPNILFKKTDTYGEN
tara:strand:+ start:52 stop:324 length:273 start_codon:yes stop_codon:yes gene_type:complete